MLRITPFHYHFFYELIFRMINYVYWALTLIYDDVLDAVKEAQYWHTVGWKIFSCYYYCYRYLDIDIITSCNRTLNISLQVSWSTQWCLCLQIKLIFQSEFSHVLQHGLRETPDISISLYPLPVWILSDPTEDPGLLGGWGGWGVWGRPVLLAAQY